MKFHSEQYVLKVQNNCPKMELRMFACVGFEATFEQLLSKSVNTARSNWSVSWWRSYPVWPFCYFSRRIQHIVFNSLKNKKRDFHSWQQRFLSLSSTLAAVHFLLQWTYRMVVILHLMRARWSLAAPAWQFFVPSRQDMFTISWTPSNVLQNQLFLSICQKSLSFNKQFNQNMM